MWNNNYYNFFLSREYLANFSWSYSWWICNISFNGEKYLISVLDLKTDRIIFVWMQWIVLINHQKPFVCTECLFQKIRKVLFNLIEDWWNHFYCEWLPCSCSWTQHWEEFFRNPTVKTNYVQVSIDVQIHNKIDKLN